MAYTWEPRWEVFEVKTHGIELRTCRDKITGLIACPICIHAASKCLGQPAPSKEYEYENSFFYTVDDLIEHLKNYHYSGLDKVVKKILTEGSAED
ncbi:MAG: hypothetical protein QXP02_05150 [Desulfurococcaceae archaeon]